MNASHIQTAGDILTRTCHEASLLAGWWKAGANGDLRDNPLAFASKLSLVHSELSEALEGDRKNAQDEHLPHRKSAEVELADAVIRIFDLAGAYGFDLGAAIADKLAYNAERADHKPKARAAAGGKKY